MSEKLGFSHGKQPCRECFKGCSDRRWHLGALAEFSVASTKWSLRPNPGYWGDPEPKVLVLGFSKGDDQQEMIDLYLNGQRRFEDVPFNSVKGTMRKDLAELLATLGLVPPGVSIDHLFENSTHGFGFASLIRCSVEMQRQGKKPTRSGDGILSCTLTETPPFVDECIDRYVLQMPNSVRLVIMLGADIKYVEACRRKLGGCSLGQRNETPYAYTKNGRVFIHVPHPSGQAGGFRAVFNAKRSPNKREEGMLLCRRLALAAVQRALSPHKGVSQLDA
ncbi:hypothetical protein LCL97_18135 [Seohaeicola saemankumensis]|nr:hypothetical protein [Seohaeicola saemankumensis]MCA0872756.1 hypothetical protein [Seohaeicola saemankumensis]